MISPAHTYDSVAVVLCGPNVTVADALTRIASRPIDVTGECVTVAAPFASISVSHDTLKGWRFRLWMRPARITCVSVTAKSASIVARGSAEPPVLPSYLNEGKGRNKAVAV